MCVVEGVDGDAGKKEGIFGMDMGVMGMVNMLDMYVILRSEEFERA